ncbi:MAG: DUF115 domain-containing protein [Sulfurimonas sp.]|nr:DUF115 domain-containing protein [Sulfurimonas sp.]
MNSIEDQALQTYQNNMDYFSTQHPEVYKKLNLLNIAIETGQYKEKYSLEYKNNYFDIQELESQQFLYGENSNEISKKVAKKVNHTKTENVIETFYNQNLSENYAQQFHDIIEISYSPLYATSNLIFYTTKNAPKATTTLKRLEKYIFFGVGNGKHLELIQNKIKSSKVLIIEDDLELFRLSLFTIDYNKVFENIKIFYSIAENNSEFKSTFENYLISGYNHNHYLKYTIFSENYISKIKKIQDIIITQNYIAYPYATQLKNILKTPEYLVENYNYLNISEHVNNNFFVKKSVLLLAAGPSLLKQIDWVKANQNKFIIICVLASLQTLYKHNIKPDIVVNLDPDEILLKFFKGIKVESFLSDTIFVFSSMVSKKVSNMVPKKNIYIFESNSHCKQNFGSITSPSVGELSYGLLLIFGIKTLYMLGLDLALDAETKRMYANEEHERGGKLNNEMEDVYNHQLEHTVAYVKGNFLDKVPTIPIFKTSIHDFGMLHDMYQKPDQTVYNLSDGAFLKGTIPLKIEDFNLTNMDIFSKPLRNELENFFQSFSQNHVNQDDTDYISEALNEGIYLFDTLKDYNLKKSYPNLDLYMLTLSQLINTLIGKEKEKALDINYIMYSYFLYITPYIFDFFNTKELSNNKKHIKKINTILVSQIEKILNIYIKTMHVYKLFAEKSL